MEMQMKTQGVLEQEVRWGGLEEGPATRRLREQLERADHSTDELTLLETIRELQQALVKERHRSDVLAEQLEQQKTRSTPDASTISEASRALTRLMRGECRSQSAVEQHWDGPVRTHDRLCAGICTRQLATSLLRGQTTTQETLQAICELVDAFDDMSHEIEELELDASATCDCVEWAEEIDQLTEQRDLLAAHVVRMSSDLRSLLGDRTRRVGVGEAIYAWAMLVARLRARLPPMQ